VILPREIPDSTYAVLGLVDKVPGSSGYDLVAVANRSFAHFWPISQTLLYKELDRLTDLKWVTATRIDQIRAPGKWIYKISKAGERALTDWLASAIQGHDTFRSPMLLRFFYGHRMHPDHLRRLLAAYREELQAQHDEFHTIMDKLADVPTPAARSGRLTALHGLHTAAARLRWVDEVHAELERGEPG
jgi:PadR family transcriptional regulator, regulatory protein AphA